MALIGITGGIGAGKSIVSRVLRLKGYAVYDSDTEAKRLMDESIEIIESIRGRFGDECVECNGLLNRKEIAKRVFANEEDLRWLNSIVHSVVRADLCRWNECQKGIRFVESAILHSSGLDELCKKIWIVDAPEELRLERAVGRGGIDRENIKHRMNVQREELSSIDREKCETILNFGDHSLLQQIDNLLEINK